MRVLRFVGLPDATRSRLLCTITCRLSALSVLLAALCPDSACNMVTDVLLRVDAFVPCERLLACDVPGV